MPIHNSHEKSEPFTSHTDLTNLFTMSMNP